MSSDVGTTLALLDDQPTVHASTPETNIEGTPLVIFDSLPYIDTVNEDYEQYAVALIEDEMKSETHHQHIAAYKRRKISEIENAPVKFRTGAMQEAYERVTSQLNKSPPHPHQDAGLPQPPPDDCLDVQVWKEAVVQARLSFETERIRSVQLEVDKDDTVGSSGASSSAADVWKRYNSTGLEPMQTAMQEKLLQQKRHIESINFLRQQDQCDRIGPKLQVQISQYQELLHKQFQLRGAIVNLKEELVPSPNAISEQ